MFYILDTGLNVIAVVENYKSAIWTSRYYESGDFELYLPATTENIQLFHKDYYIVREGDWTQAMFVSNIEITTDVEAGNYLTVTGKSLQSILERRVIFPQTTVKGTVEECIRALITQNIINPAVPERKIDNFILGAEVGIENATISTQFTGDNLGETITELCKAHGLGFDIALDIEEKQFVFILYKGADRSYNQNENPYVVFSPEFENLLSSNYVNKSEGYKNVAIVAGEGEGTDRKNTMVGTASGVNRYELFVDAKDVSSKVDDETLSTSEYTELLTARGNEKLSEIAVTEEVEGEIILDYNYVLNKDFFLGDIVEVVNEYGMSFTPRIIEVIESEDDTGTTAIVAFETAE